MLNIQTPRVHRILQVAAILNLSRSSVYRLIADGELQRIKLGSRAAGITVDSIDAYLLRKSAEGM